MCVIISKQPGQVVPPEIVEDCYFANPDGFGIAQHDGRKLHGRKGLLTLPQIQAIVARATPHRAFLHFRIRTAGAISPQGCHPYRIAKKSALLMHNGCLDIVPESSEQSDTAALAAILNTYTPREIVAARDSLSEWHGASNRLAIMFGDGTTLRTGTWRAEDGLQYSNLHWQTNYTYSRRFEYSPRQCAACEEDASEYADYCETCRNW